MLSVLLICVPCDHQHTVHCRANVITTSLFVYIWQSSMCFLLGTIYRHLMSIEIYESVEIFVFWYNIPMMFFLFEMNFIKAFWCVCYGIKTLCVRNWISKKKRYIIKITYNHTHTCTCLNREAFKIDISFICLLWSTDIKNFKSGYLCVGEITTSYAVNLKPCKIPTRVR